MTPEPNIEGEPTGIDSVEASMGAAEDPTLSASASSFVSALGSLTVALTKNPLAVGAANARLAFRSASAMTAAAGRAVGLDTQGPASTTRDRRFSDPAFTDNAGYFLLAQEYLLLRSTADEMLEAADLSDVDAEKARFALGFLLDALAPTNVFMGNPAAVRRAFETGGISIVRGLMNFIDDVRNNGGWPAQVDASGFELGANLAATPGSVVYRSDLIELIQYAPQTDTVHEVPLLFCPPWINKFYIMDLAPDRSLIEWAVQHGHTCYAISYRNPDASMADFGFDDYLKQGFLDAVRVVRSVSQSDQVNTISLCLGGTLTAMGLAHAAATGDTSVRSATFLNTHTDFTQRGLLGLFTDEAAVADLEKRMEKQGYLESTGMAHTFDLLRANDLIFNYVGRNWLQGQRPPAFDLLAWNADGTRLPARMHSEYLRSCYLDNAFARGTFSIDGQLLDPAKVDVDTYVLSAVDDHIVPWTSAYKTTQLFSGDRRFVLSTSGHVAGVVNPPSPKAKHWVNDSLPADPEVWKADATLVDTTWWDDWTAWISQRAGAQISAPLAAGSDEFPVLCSAPGEYVRQR